MYAFQQAFFRSKGIKNITLYRGVDDKSGVSQDAPLGSVVNCKTRRISSFTANPGIAGIFTSDNPMILEYDIPVESIFMSPFVESGLGLQGPDVYSYHEEEYIVLGASDLKGVKCKVAKKVNKVSDKGPRSDNYEYGNYSFDLFDYEVTK